MFSLQKGLQGASLASVVLFGLLGFCAGDAAQLGDLSNQSGVGVRGLIRRLSSLDFALIEVLSFSSDGIDGDDVDLPLLASAVGRFTNLRSIDFANNRIGDLSNDRVGVRGLTSLMSALIGLQTLRAGNQSAQLLNACDRAQSHLDVVASRARAQSTASLEEVSTAIGFSVRAMDQFAQIVTRPPQQSFNSVNLSNNCIGDKHAKVLVEVWREAILRSHIFNSFNLSNNNIGAGGAIAFAGFISENRDSDFAKKLRLDLTNNPIGERGRAALEEARQFCPGLRF